MDSTNVTSKHAYQESTSNMFGSWQGGVSNRGSNISGIPSRMDNVGWAWSRVKVRRGNDDPLSLLDVDNINLSWQRMSMDENTREEYRVTYEKGDIVITNGIAAEVEANRHRKKLQIREHRKSEHEILGTFNTSQKQSQTKSPKKQSGSERTRRRSERSETIGSARSSRHRSKKSLLSHRAKALTYDVSTASSASIRRIFVAIQSNTDSHPMSKDGEINWKELRLTSKAWSNFVQNYFKSVHPLYAIGHFNYLHDVKCPTPPSLIDNTIRDKRIKRQSSFENGGRATTLRDLLKGGSSKLDVECHDNYDIAFEDFMISLVPILDARRIDTCKCTEFNTMTHTMITFMPTTRKWLILWFMTPFINYFFDGLVVINTIFLVSEIALEDALGQNNTDCNSSVIALCYLQVIILCIFMIELLSKIYAFGFLRFWRSTLNKIDLFAIVVSFLFLVILGTKCGLDTEENRNMTCNTDNILAYDVGFNISSNENTRWKQHYQSGGAETLLPIFRIIRIFRLFRVLRSVRVELRVIKKLTPLFIRFLGVLFFFYYIFGVIGMELFAGRMHYTIPAVQLSSYGKSQYYMNTFDSIYLTFMTLFELMVVNNWNIIMEGYVAATDSEWTRLYFIIWFIVSVIVVMNVCAGFVIDAYSLLKPKMQKEVKYLSQILEEKFAKKNQDNQDDQDDKDKAFNCRSCWNAHCSGRVAYNRFKDMNLDELLNSIDTEYMVSSMPTVNHDQKKQILFDQQLQNQLNIRVREHEHSYNQLTQAYALDEENSDDEDDQ